MGGADLQDERLEALSLATGFTVVSVAYRLAPEHPHPAGADDCETAACWLAAAGRTVFGTERFVIGGESAGAHLSAVTLLRLRDRHGTVGAFAGACLAYGMYDLGMSPSALQRGPRRIVLSTPIIDYHRRCLLGGAVDPTDPDVSPIQASLHGLPPALLSVGTDDPLVDDSVFFWARWRLAGSPARIDLYEGGFHAFDLFPGRVAEVCTARQWAFLTACATGDGDPLGTVATRR
jgi:acetyl esterase/lipase